MPDISKCEGTKCPLKESCYRFTSKSSGEKQSYLIHPPFDFEEGHCHLYVQTTLKKDS